MGKWRVSLLFLLIGHVFLVRDASGGAFRHLTAREAGMGGAGVALAEGGLAPYWNPARLAEGGEVDLHLELGSSYENRNDFLARTDAAIAAVNQAIETEAFADIAVAVAAVEALGGDFAQIEPNVSLGLRWARYALHFVSYDTAAAGVSGVTFLPDLPGEYSANVSGLQIGEIALSHGRRIRSGGPSVGLSLKAIGGVGIEGHVPLRTIDRMESFLREEAAGIAFNGVAFTFDLGLSYPLANDRVAIAIVGKNLTAPRIDVGGGETEKFPPMVRFGVGGWIAPWWRVEFDLDATRNTRRLGFDAVEGTVEEVTTREVSFGSEWLLTHRWASATLRSGISNTLRGGEGRITAGLGLRCFFLEISAAAGTNFDFDIEASGFGQIGVMIRFE